MAFLATPYTFEHSVRLVIRAACAIALLGTLAACSDAPRPDVNRMEFDGIVHRTPVRAPAGERQRGPTCGSSQPVSGQKGAASLNNAATAANSPQQGYRVGPGDDLKLNIFGEEGMRELVARVDAEGFIQLPMIDAIKVTGRTTREIQSALKQYYSTVFIQPWVTVELANAESQPLYFLGEFREPGVYYMEFATELVQAIAMPEGIEEDAYLKGARLLRDGSVCTVDIYALLKDGDFSQNVWMQPRDVVYVPLKEEMRIYLLGAVGSPGAVPFGPDGRTLLEALSMAQGPIEEQAHLEEVRIIRSSSPTSGELIIVDVNKLLAAQRLDFPLEPGDVVYVPRTPLGSWNLAVQTILPSLQLVGGILTPIALIDSLLYRPR
jgi:polysaccharide export outer membrane protein